MSSSRRPDHNKDLDFIEYLKKDGGTEDSEETISIKPKESKIEVNNFL